jgi:archaellum component FlaG (FlaF/FlaG flagellin family)
MSARIPTRLAAVVLAAALGAAGLLVSSAAQAAPGDQVSISFQPGDFGPQKTGTTTRKTFTMTNDGTDPVTVDPTPVTTIAAPFAPITTTIVLGGTINPGETRSVTVDYTAGAVGSTPAQSVVFTAVSTDDPTVTGNFAFILEGESIATDPVSFEVTDPAGGIVDFGQIDVGATSTRTIIVRNNGVRDLKFESGRLMVVGSDGNPIPVTFVGVPFVVELVPGESAPLQVQFAPTSPGSIVGTITLVGVQTMGDLVIGSAQRTIEVRGSSVVPTTPTTPTTPAAGGSSVRPASSAGGQQLAHTGIEGVGGFVGGTVAVMIVLAGVAVVVERRIRKRA